MSFWIYKCNAKPQPRQSHLPTGDWDDVFNKKKEMRWGSSRYIPRLVQELRPDDLIIAYQTDRTELVGIAELVDIKKVGDRLDIILAAIEDIRVQLPQLKRLDPTIESLSAFKKGAFSTLYRISTADAWHLLNVAKAQAAIQRLTRPATKNAMTFE